MSSSLWGDGCCDYTVEFHCGFCASCDDHLATDVSDRCETRTRWTWCARPASYLHRYGLIWDAALEGHPERHWRRLCPEHCEGERRRFPAAEQPMFVGLEYPRVSDSSWESLDEDNPPQELGEQARLHRAYRTQRRPPY